MRTGWVGSLVLSGLIGLLAVLVWVRTLWAGWFDTGVVQDYGTEILVTLSAVFLIAVNTGICFVMLRIDDGYMAFERQKVRCSAVCSTHSIQCTNKIISGTWEVHHACPVSDGEIHRHEWKESSE